MLAEIYLAALANNPDEQWIWERAVALLRDWYHRQPDLFHLGRFDGTICGGFVVGVRPWWDGNHLVDGELFVHPDRQKKGVARALVRSVLQQAVAQYAPTTWETYTFRNAAFPLTWY